jgi:3-hydroxyisobutyrate dehydrogenase
MTTDARRDIDADTGLHVGWIGLGVMGAPMAGHLLRAGHRVTVHTRTKVRAAGLLEQGAAWADDAAAAADDADVVFSIVGLPDDVAETHLGPRGTLAAARPPRLIVDMTTSRPRLAVEIEAAARARGVGSVDAPVSGGDVGARNATLSIMVGGADEHVDAVRPLLARLGDRIVHHGPAGTGQHAKMVNQILIAANMVGVCEGMLYAATVGLDPEKVIESVGSGAAGSWSINTLGPRMIRRDFEPGFLVEHFVKDLSIAVEEADRMGLTLPGLALARRLYDLARLQDLGRRGTQALLLVLERMHEAGDGPPDLFSSALAPGRSPADD